MKRRNADCGKLRRPIKRNKITEGMYGSTTVLYMKFLILWAIVITADFMFMFRFEFLWPFWLLLRSVHDSFKYKGLAFSVLFVCIAITSDLVCLFFIPVHWLLFAASTYVWVQYVWHTDKGICLPTIILWMLFVYLEAGIRWKDSRHMPHLDLCRPFAAHCIGYPVVTLGFGFKSYVGYRMRQRKQREVSKENEFYMQLLQQALPPEETTEDAQTATATAAGTLTAAAAAIGNGGSSSSSSITAGSPTQIAQNSLHSNHNSNAITTIPNAVITAATANGILTTQAQNHHNDHHQHHTHHNNSSSSSNNNNNNSSSNNSSSYNNNSNISAAAAAAMSASASTTTFAAASGGASSGGNTAFGVTSSAISSSTLSNIIDDKSYVQIGGNGGGGGNASIAYNHIFNNNYNNNSSTNATNTNSSNNNPNPNNNHQHQHHNHNHNNNIQTHHHQHHHSSNNNNANNHTKNAQSNSTSNGHIGGNAKSHRRSMDKENKNKGANNSSSSNVGDTETSTTTATTKHNNKSNNYQQLHVDHSNNSKDRSDYENGNYQVHQMQSQSAKEKHDENRASKKSNNNTHNAITSPTANGNVLQYDADDAVAVEPVVERTKGRRNRSKKDNSSKDNHHHQQQHQQQHHNNNSHSNNTNSSNHLHNNHQQQQQQQQNTNKDNNTTTQNHHNNNSDASSVSSSASTSSTHSSSSTSLTSPTTFAATAAISNLASKVVSKICESCLKLEADIKKCRSVISHMKQIENELRQKLESNLTTKSCLQVKQKECDELEKRIQELSNARHADLLIMQNFERRLTEERRQKQSLDAQLCNEKKARKLAEEKAARPECSAQCKQRKHQMDEEIKQLRRDLKLCEEAKQLAEQHGRKWEQELRMFEAEIRNRDSNQPGTEMLMNALAAMQDKNCTLEKNLSAETRVKLDLFSALGDAKRQLEIAESRRRAKEDEVHDLKAKIAQLLAVMPTDSLCLPSCSSTGASSMLRMNDTPPLQTGGGPGPASPMLSSLSAQQTAAANVHQMNARVGPPNSPDYVQQAQNDYVSNQQQQQQCAGVVPVSIAAGVVANNMGLVNAVGSNHPLDPNATIYTPKGGPGGGGGAPGVVVVGGAGDA